MQACWGPGSGHSALRPLPGPKSQPRPSRAAGSHRARKQLLREGKAERGRTRGGPSDRPSPARPCVSAKRTRVLRDWLGPARANPSSRLAPSALGSRRFKSRTRQGFAKTKLCKEFFHRFILATSGAGLVVQSQPFP